MVLVRALRFTLFDGIILVVQSTWHHLLHPSPQHAIPSFDRVERTFYSLLNLRPSECYQQLRLAYNVSTPRHICRFSATNFQRGCPKTPQLIGTCTYDSNIVNAVYTVALDLLALWDH